MKRISSLIIFSLAAAGTFVSCRKADPVMRSEENLLSDIYATNDGNGGQRLFNPRYSNDTIYFDIPYFYPEDSDNETDLSRIILRGSIPSDAKLSPALGSFADLRNPYPIKVTSGTGEEKHYVVIGKKVGNTTIETITVTYMDADGEEQQIEGVVQPSGDVLFYVLPGTTLTDARISYAINRHSSASIAQDGAVDFAQPVPFIITGVDGIAKTYTLKATEPVKLDYGIGINRKLWSKGGADLGFSANNEVCLAVSGDNIVITRRTNPSKFSVYNRFTAAFVRDIPSPFGSQLSFQMVEDTVGHLLAASWAPKNAKFILYKYNDAMDNAPVKFLEWTNNNPAGITGDGGVGRRMNIYGNLDGNAVIMAPAGMSNIIYKWRVVGGTLLSQTPEVITYNGLANGATSFGYYAEAQPVSAGANANYFINYQFDIALVNGTTHERMSAFSYDTRVYGVFHMPTAYVTFNNATYLAIVKYSDYNLNKINMCLFDVTSTSKISTPFTDPNYGTFNVFVSDEFAGTANGNGTADIAVGFSQNKERMQVYTLLTNGGIMAHEFTLYAP